MIIINNEKKIKGKSMFFKRKNKSKKNAKQNK